MNIEQEVIEQIEENEAGQSLLWVCDFIRSLGISNPLDILHHMWKAGYLVFVTPEMQPCQTDEIYTIIRTPHVMPDYRVLATDKGSSWAHYG